MATEEEPEQQMTTDVSPFSWDAIESIMESYGDDSESIKFTDDFTPEAYATQFHGMEAGIQAADQHAAEHTRDYENMEELFQKTHETFNEARLAEEAYTEEMKKFKTVRQRQINRKLKQQSERLNADCKKMVKELFEDLLPIFTRVERARISEQDIPLPPSFLTPPPSPTRRPRTTVSPGMSEFHVEEHKSSAPAPPLTPMRQQRDDDLVRTPPMRIPSLDQTVSDFMRSLTPRDIYDVPTPPTTAERQLFETTPRDMTTDDIPTPPKPIPTLSPPRGTTPPGLRGTTPLGLRGGFPTSPDQEQKTPDPTPREERAAARHEQRPARQETPIRSKH
jgi:hypothetical protein